MKRHSQWIIACTVLWLSACSTLTRPVVLDNDTSPVRRQAEVRTRWVGMTNVWSRRCPAPSRTSGWTVRPLFPLDRLTPGLKSAALEAKLNRFCVYQYKGRAPVSRRLTLPPEISARLRSVEPDRLALSGMSTLQEETSPNFSALFFQQVQSAVNLPVTGTEHVRLVFLDTQPTGDGIPNLNVPPSSRHGYTLEHIAGNLAGPLACRANNPNPCAIEVASRLALPVVSFDPATQVLVTDTTHGGFRGTLADLSDALWAELTLWDQWSVQRPSIPKPSRLVLNLSIGWDGEKLKGWEENLAVEDEVEVAILAIHNLLQTATQQGVLVIAAAGNERGGLDSKDQPLLPGGWEKPYRKSQQGIWGWKNLGAPPIYAASGVDGWKHPLVNTRKAGEAPRVAYADHVAVPDLNDLNNPPTQYTATLTGTSVAAAVISTIAAVVWSYQHNLQPGEVMGSLYASGEPLPRKHDFSAPSVPPVDDVRRITLCRAVLQAWDNTPDFAQCGGVSPSPLNLSAFHADYGPLPLDVTPPPLPPSPHPDVQEGCWNCPLPGSNPCPNCTVDIDPPAPLPPPPSPEMALAVNTSSRSLQPSFAGNNDTCRLLIEIPSGWTASDLQEATLELFRFDSAGRKDPLGSISLDTNAFQQSQSSTMEVTFEKPSVPFQAAVSFVLAPKTQGASPLSIVSPLFVDSP